MEAYKFCKNMLTENGDISYFYFLRIVDNRRLYFDRDAVCEF